MNTALQLASNYFAKLSELSVNRYCLVKASRKNVLRTVHATAYGE
jgi:hypothetical protein